VVRGLGGVERYVVSERVGVEGSVSSPGVVGGERRRR